MTRAVWKYPLAVTARQKLNIPGGAKLLAVQVQRCDAMLWALVDPAEPFTERCILIAGTGHEIEEPRLDYIATFQLQAGALVFHAFEVMP